MTNRPLVFSLNPDRNLVLLSAMRFVQLFVLTAWVLLGSLSHVFAAEVTPPTDQKPQGAHPANNPIHFYTNSRYLDWVRGFAKRKGLAVHEVGTDRVRALIIGDTTIDMAQPLAQANLCLDGLEAITGNQDSFSAKAPASGEIYYQVLFATTDQVLKLIDDGRAKKMLPQPTGIEDLSKKYPNFQVTRCSVSSVQLVSPVLQEWAVSSVAANAVDAFFRCRNANRQAPTWLQEGLESDMQQLICSDIRCYTVSYEDPHYHITANWFADIKNLIASGSLQNKNASELMTMTLDALPIIYYQQMWSLTTFIRQSCGVQKGAASKMHKLLTLLADGSSGPEAIKEVLKKSDAQLTRAWREWAVDAEATKP